MAISVRKSCVIPTAPKPTNIATTMSFLATYQLKSLLKEDKRKLAIWTRDQLQMLGPTFIKVGQFVSTRPDIFSPEMIQEFQALQDNVAPVCANVIEDIVDRELGLDAFSSFESEPIASASISQVHLATLKTGERVAVKVQRPHIRAFFDRDFKTLNMIFDALSLFNIRSVNDSKMLIEQCYTYLYEELCFERELDNARLFRDIVVEHPNLVVPDVYPKYSSKNVLTMSYLPSNRIGPNETSALAVELMEFFIEQVVFRGVIHADPHPGNLGITAEGRIALYDFGQVSKLDPVLVANIKPLLFSIADRDVSEITQLLIKSKAIILLPNADISQIESFVQAVLLYFENLDFRSFSLAEDIAMDPPFKINPQLIMVFRSLSLLEGICKSLDPEFSYFTVIEVFIGRLFFDIDYLEYRARKDFAKLLGNEQQEKTSQTATVIRTPTQPAVVVDSSNTILVLFVMTIAAQSSIQPADGYSVIIGMLGVVAAIVFARI